MSGAIVQLIHTLSYGDAISNETLSLDRAFKDQGRQSSIYALNVHERHQTKVSASIDLSGQPGGTMVMHYSLGSPLNKIYKEQPNCRKVLIFHNLTPVKYFAGINPRIVKDLEHGWDELPELCAMSDEVIADSPYNAAELAKIGIKSKVLPLPFDPARWTEVANPGIANLVRSAGGIQLLHVGRLAPNKCVEDIIKTFYFIHHHIDKRSRLWLVGIDIDTEMYSFALKRLCRELGLQDFVNFTGSLSDSEVRALYENCSAYLCMSEHEGFCVPLIEAMQFSLPTVAYKSTAIPDTMGSGGVVVAEKRYPDIAELISELAKPGQLRARIVEAGRKRVSELSYDAFCKNVSDLFPRTAA